MPLIKEAMWACKRLLETDNNSISAFPRYYSEAGRKANSASGSLNKWLDQYVPKNCVIHSFRHSLRDRLRAVQCPSDMIDQIGGWSTAGVGQRFVEGYGLTAIKVFLRQM